MIIDIYGFVIECQFASSDLGLKLVRPFVSFKKNDGQPAVTIVVKEELPPYADLPCLKASFSTPRSIIYKSKEIKFIDYFGKGMVVENKTNSLFHIYSRDINLLQEVFYFLIISLFGMYCDKKWMLRIHALGLSYHDRAIIFMATPGGGKSTMALSMLSEEGIKLISDDSLILTRHGEILPFALRIGLPGEYDVTSIPEEYLYRIDRMEFGEKYFVDCNFWKEKIEKRHLKDAILLVSVRSLKGEPYIERISKFGALGALFRDAVIGIGLYQGMEFMFSHSPWEVFLKIPIIFKRLLLAIKLTRSSKTYRFVLSRDVASNTRIFKGFIQINNRRFG